MTPNPKARKLFEDFPPISTEHWENKIMEDLKGADYDKKLIWKTLEGIAVKPYYRSEHLNDKAHLHNMPGEFPYIRGNRKNTNDWEIRQDIKLNDIQTANQRSLFVLGRGISSLGFITPPFRDSSLLSNQDAFRLLFKDIYIDCIGLYFVCGFNAPQILKLLKNEIASRGIDKNLIRGAVDYDPLGYLSSLGNFSLSEEHDFSELSELIRFAEAEFPSFKVLGINGYFFHNAGGSAVQEIAFSLSMAAEYLARLSEAGFNADTISKHIQFNLGVGSNYFMEIAKIRAFRYLWSQLISAFHPEREDSKKADIHSITSEWNQTIYDPYVNVLRATTESMAAVIGGTDSLTVRPFTYAYKPTTKFSGRIARNIQIILKEEAYLGKIVDPSAGSYYIENLTDSLIAESWKLFLKVEDQGGYLSALKKGTIQADIEASASSRNQDIAYRREVLLGTNQYASSQDRIADDIDTNLVFPEPTPGQNLVTPIRRYRASMDFERLRLATELHSKIPKVFLLTIGNITMRKARASFSGNFFASAGYEVIDQAGFNSPEEGVQAAIENQADILVICSSDDEYPGVVPQVAEALGNKAILVVAGAPSCMEDLKQRGIYNFIHMRSNQLEVLRDFHTQLGIKFIL